MLLLTDLHNWLSAVGAGHAVPLQLHHDPGGNSVRKHARPLL